MAGFRRFLYAACAAWLCLAAPAGWAAPGGDGLRGRPCAGAAGEVQGVNCVPAALSRRPACRGEGQDVEGKEPGAGCCEGLAAIAESRPEEGECRSAPPSVKVCARCGDGVCGKGENRCNCAEDCARK
jgi:hypothetical protein